MDTEKDDAVDAHRETSFMHVFLYGRAVSDVYMLVEGIKGKPPILCIGIISFHFCKHSSLLL